MRNKRNTGGTITTVYEYGYSYDGGRRWRKDYLQNQWTWYPCGVACSAGELVEQQSDLTGATWTTVGQQLRVGSGCTSMLLRRNGENHHNDLVGNNPVITDANSNILSSNLYDFYRTQRFSSGMAQSQWKFNDHYLAEEGMIANCFIQVERDIALSLSCMKSINCIPVNDRPSSIRGIRECTGARLEECESLCAPFGGVRQCCERWRKSISRHREPPVETVWMTMCGCNSTHRIKDTIS